MYSLGCKFLGSSTVIEERLVLVQGLGALAGRGQDEVLEAPGTLGHRDSVQQLLVGLQLRLVTSEEV